MFHKATDLTFREGTSLEVRFRDGKVKQYDMASLFDKYPQLKALEDRDLFLSGKLMGAYGIVWNEDIDIDTEEVYQNGRDVETPFSGLISFSDAAVIKGLNESTLRKAVEYGKLIPGVDVCNLGKQWIITKEALEREYPEKAKPSETAVGGETE